MILSNKKLVPYEDYKGITINGFSTYYLFEDKYADFLTNSQINTLGDETLIVIDFNNYKTYHDFVIEDGFVLNSFKSDYPYLTEVTQTQAKQIMKNKLKRLEPEASIFIELNQDQFLFTSDNY